MNGLSNSIGNADESTEENVPKILRPELRDVFHQFANTLDAKSFMNLAMTNKKMYKQCLEDKSIKINVNVKSFHVYGDEDGVGFFMRSSSVSDRHLGCYMATLRKQPFSITLSEVRINCSVPADYLNATRNYLTNFGVKRIKMLEITEDFTDWEAIIIFVKEFNVKILKIWDADIPLPILHSLLQLELDEFFYGGSVPVDFVLELESPIQKIEFAGFETVEWDKFMQLLWKIQSGSLKYILVNYDVFSEDTEMLEFDYEGVIPDDRPLIFQGMHRGWEDGTYYILHWQGGVTKCIEFDADYDEDGGFHKLIYKCQNNELPPILRNDEDVLKDLSEMVPKVSCLSRQFNKYISGIEWLAPVDRLPSERPLYFKAENRFVQLTKDEQLMECAWHENYAMWMPFEYRNGGYTGYPPLEKLMFNKHLREQSREDRSFYCEGLDELDSWLEGYRKVDFEHTGPLPVERPIIFEKRPSEEGNIKFCAILFNDHHLIQCELLDTKVKMEPCKPWNRPPILIDEHSVMKVLQATFLERRKGVNFRVGLDTFLTGFEFFKKSPDRCLSDFKKTENIDGKIVVEIWFNFNGLCKFLWQDDRAWLAYAAANEIPFEFVMENFKHCAETEMQLSGIFMNREQFHSCLEHFETFPFYYGGPLPKNSPFAFVKEEIRHSCSSESDCECSEILYRVWLLCDGVNLSYCTWGTREKRGCLPYYRGSFDSSSCADRREVVFDSFEEERPPILNSRIYLKIILEKSEGGSTCWYGCLDEFLACFEDYTKISAHHKGALPEERPLLMERDSGGKYSRYLLLKTGTVVKAEWSTDETGATVQTIFPLTEPIPSVFMSVLL